MICVVFFDFDAFKLCLYYFFALRGKKQEPLEPCKHHLGKMQVKKVGKNLLEAQSDSKKEGSCESTLQSILARCKQEG